MEKVDGTELENIIIGVCDNHRVPSCHKIGYSESEWLEHISPEIRRGLSKILNLESDDDPKLDQMLQELKNGPLKGGPYVLTHTDLNFSNIWVYSDAKITAILDWETAGFYPWWAELFFFRHLPDDCGMVRDLFAMIRHDLCSGYDEDNYYNDIVRPLVRLSDTYRECPTAHDAQNWWIRTPFCKCKPIAGAFHEISLGYPNGTGHRILEKYEEHTSDSRKEFYKARRAKRGPGKWIGTVTRHQKGNERRSA